MASPSARLGDSGRNGGSKPTITTKTPVTTKTEQMNANHLQRGRRHNSLPLHDRVAILQGRMATPHFAVTGSITSVHLLPTGAINFPDIDSSLEDGEIEDNTIPSDRIWHVRNKLERIPKSHWGKAATSSPAPLASSPRRAEKRASGRARSLARTPTVQPTPIFLRKYRGRDVLRVNCRMN